MAQEEKTLRQKLYDCFNEVAKAHPEWEDAIGVVVEFSLGRDGRAPELCIDLKNSSGGDPEFMNALREADKVIKAHKGPIR